ncbi:MAG: PASTA domain-containing protein [Oscillospiraceae bacterium]|nr:PASTA domain-containing protein [Oscillospiraceae bacterium]
MEAGRGLNQSSMFRRTVVVAVLLGVVAFAILIGWLAKVQLVDYEDYQKRAVSQQTRNEIIPASRGSIYDANMNTLAVSVSSETVCISPADIDENELDLVCEGLAALLGPKYNVTYEDVEKKASNKKSYYAYIVKKVDEETANAVRTFIKEYKLGSEIFLVEDSSRYYPYGRLGSQILGFCGTDNNGLYGIEYSMDGTLQGTPGRIVSQKNAAGTDLNIDFEQYYDAVDGSDIVLSIDAVIQGYLESALEEARANAGAKHVSGIVMDVRNAQIKAMATDPNFDPNDPFVIPHESILDEIRQVEDPDERKTAYSAALADLWTNGVISTSYEPGSVFKIITAAMALEESVTTLYDNSFVCNGSGSITILDRTIGCWSDKPHGQETFLDGIKNSCNPVFIDVSRRLGGSNFFKYFVAFGLTEKTGIELSGESGGASILYHSETELNTIPITLATSSFGQTFNVTPLQMITAVSAAVNGGTLYKPCLIRQIVGSDGTILESHEAERVRQVVTSQTSRDLCFALEKVVSEGTGSNAYVKGYSVGGKTGTTVKTVESTEDAKVYISSFLGLAPTDAPQLAVLILVDEPDPNKTHSGNMLAAPYVAEVLEKSLHYLGVDPVYTPDEYQTLDVTIPDFTGMSLREVEEYMKLYDLNYRIEGEAEFVTSQMPVPGALIPRSEEIVIYMGGSKPNYSVGIPNVVGMTLSGIQRLLRNSPLYIRAVGNTSTNTKTLSVRQEPEYGEFVEAGSVLTVYFVNDTSDQNIQ